MYNDLKYLLSSDDPEYKTVDSYYKDGYAVGYGWLKSGANFKHPNTPGGYIPGGPIIWQHRYGFKGAYDRTKAWKNGFIDGINAYVKKYNLPYTTVVSIYS